MTLVAAGQCTITANQAGDPSFLGADPVVQSFAVNTPDVPVTQPAVPGTQPDAPAQTAQTITVDPVPDIIVESGQITLNATTTSGLPVIVTSSTPDVCTVSGLIVTPVAPGTCTIVVEQPGNDQFGSAPTVTHSFTIRDSEITQTFQMFLPTLTR